MQGRTSVLSRRLASWIASWLRGIRWRISFFGKWRGQKGMRKWRRAEGIRLVMAGVILRPFLLFCFRSKKMLILCFFSWVHSFLRDFSKMNTNSIMKASRSKLCDGSVQYRTDLYRAAYSVYTATPWPATWRLTRLRFWVSFSSGSWSYTCMYSSPKP